MPRLVESPHISAFAFPEEEIEAVLSLSRALSALGDPVRCVHAALQLFDICEEQEALTTKKREEYCIARKARGPSSVEDSDDFLRESDSHFEALDTLGEWKFIAARDAALQIFHLGKGMLRARAELRY